ncbi:MAG: hypothetical protein K9K93_08100, partial [Acholeplasmataceae bacterium]|nr:hypothetical protein [Acholeplasmataceae bacterium]
IGDYRQKQRAYYGIVADKYANLLPKAIGFKSIAKVDSFVNDFLLDDSKIDIKGLKENMVNLESLRAVIQKEQMKLKLLKDIEEHANQYDKHTQWISINELANIQVNIRKTESELQALSEKESTQGYQLKQIDKDIGSSKNRIEERERIIAELKADIAQNESYRTLEGYKTSISDYQNKKLENDGHFEKFKTAVYKERQIIKHVRNHDEHAFRTMNAFLSQDSFDSASFREHFLSYQAELNDLKETYGDKKRALEANINQLNKDIREIEKTIEQLKRGIKPYTPDVVDMMTVIKQRLAETNGRDVNVQPICELCDITDHTKRNAIEGYLSIHKFDLFVQPEYVNDAFEIYREHSK